jgi:hypothetical protein
MIRGSLHTRLQGSVGADEGDEDQEDHESMPVQILLKVFSEIFELRNKGCADSTFSFSLFRLSAFPSFHRRPCSLVILALPRASRVHCL